MTLRVFPDGAPIGVSALVTIEDERGQQHVLVAMHGGGETLAGGVRVVTIQSPLGRALVGKCEGDEIELVQAGRTRSLAVVTVR
jgi:transcription elongation GreA/GreB family factor